MVVSLLVPWQAERDDKCIRQTKVRVRGVRYSRGRDFASSPFSSGKAMAAAPSKVSKAAAAVQRADWAMAAMELGNLAADLRSVSTADRTVITRDLIAETGQVLLARMLSKGTEDQSREAVTKLFRAVRNGCVHATSVQEVVVSHDAFVCSTLAVLEQMARNGPAGDHCLVAGLQMLGNSVVGNEVARAKLWQHDLLSSMVRIISHIPGTSEAGVQAVNNACMVMYNCIVAEANHGRHNAFTTSLPGWTFAAHALRILRISWADVVELRANEGKEQAEWIGLLLQHLCVQGYFCDLYQGLGQVIVNGLPLGEANKVVLVRFFRGLFGDQIPYSASDYNVLYFLFDRFKLLCQLVSSTVLRRLSLLMCCSFVEAPQTFCLVSCPLSGLLWLIVGRI